MQDSHTTTGQGDKPDQPSPLRLADPVAVLGLLRQLAGRLDGHLTAFVAHMTQGLLAASTAVGDDEHDGEHEVALEAYQMFASTDLLAEGIVARMLAGLSTRRYPAGLEPVGEEVDQQASGTSKSAVSRRFVQ